MLLGYRVVTLPKIMAETLAVVQLKAVPRMKLREKHCRLDAFSALLQTLTLLLSGCQRPLHPLQDL